MKKLFALALAVAMSALMAVPALADTSSDSVYPGGDVEVYGFYDKDGNEAPDEGSWDLDYYGLSYSFTKGKQYVKDVYVEDGCVYLRIVTGIETSSDKEIRGTVRMRDKESKDTYTAEINDLYLNASEASPIYETNAGEFELPYDYQTNKVKFRTEDGEDIGTLYANFVNDNYETLAYFKVKVVEQESLYLGHNQNDDVEFMKKYPNANIRFLNWDSNPTFEVTGTLGIVMEEDEYLYQRKADGSLVAVSGTYNEDRGTFDFKTNTLGQYVISDQKLNASGSTASSSSSAASSKPASSSTAPAPSSSSTAPAPSSSSTAPAPSSSSTAPAPSSSEAESSSSEESSSEESSLPEESSEPESSEPEESSEESAPAESDETDNEGGLPVVPILIGAAVVVILVVLFVVLKGKGGKKKYDSWDD